MELHSGTPASIVSPDFAIICYRREECVYVVRIMCRVIKDMNRHLEHVRDVR